MAGIVLQSWMIIVAIILIAVLGIGNVIQFARVYQNPIAKVAIKAQSGKRRIAVVHYASNQCEFVIPEEEKDMNESCPVWNVKGKRFKDRTGEKWESCYDLKILNYTGRHPTPLGTKQAQALDGMDDLLAKNGFSTKGIKKEVFYMIIESAKGEKAEMEAWGNLRVRDKESVMRIKEILDFIKTHPDIRYEMFKTGAFTYQTAVTVVDQITSDTIVEISNLISFVEDRLRRKLADRFNDLAKYAVIIIPIMLVAAIAGVIFMVGSGLVKLGG